MYTAESRFHMLDTRAPFPEPLCGHTGIPPERIVNNASVISCPYCLADSHFPLQMARDIRAAFSFIDREVEQIVQERQRERLTHAAQKQAEERQRLSTEQIICARQQAHKAEVANVQARAIEEAARVAGVFANHAPGDQHVRITMPETAGLTAGQQVSWKPQPYAAIKSHINEMEDEKIAILAEKEKSAMSKLGEIMVTAGKRGLAAGTIRGVTAKATTVLAKRYPMIHMIPAELRNIIVCSIVHMVMSSRPNAAGSAKAVELAELAMEGLVTSAVATTVEELINQLGPEIDALLSFEAEAVPVRELGGEG